MENGVLFILQTRRGKRTALASVKIAVSMVQERLITERFVTSLLFTGLARKTLLFARDALMRIDPYQMDFFLHPMIDPTCGDNLF